VSRQEKGSLSKKKKMEELKTYKGELLFVSEAALDLVCRQTGIEIVACQWDGGIYLLHWRPRERIAVLTTRPAFFYAICGDTLICKVKRRSADDIGALVECIMSADSFARRFDDGVIIDASNDRCVHCGFDSNRLSELVLHFLDDCSFVKIKSALKD
jgi:hypothetical protein